MICSSIHLFKYAIANLVIRWGVASPNRPPSEQPSFCVLSLLPDEARLKAGSPSDLIQDLPNGAQSIWAGILPAVFAPNHPKYAKEIDFILQKCD